MYRWFVYKLRLPGWGWGGGGYTQPKSLRVYEKNKMAIKKLWDITCQNIYPQRGLVYKTIPFAGTFYNFYSKDFIKMEELSHKEDFILVKLYLIAHISKIMKFIKQKFNIWRHKLLDSKSLVKHATLTLAGTASMILMIITLSETQYFNKWYPYFSQIPVCLTIGSTPLPRVKAPVVAL